MRKVKNPTIIWYKYYYLYYTYNMYKLIIDSHILETLIYIYTLITYIIHVLEKKKKTHNSLYRRYVSQFSHTNKNIVLRFFCITLI